MGNALEYGYKVGDIVEYDGRKYKVKKDGKAYHSNGDYINFASPESYYKLKFKIGDKIRFKYKKELSYSSTIYTVVSDTEAWIDTKNKSRGWINLDRDCLEYKLVEEPTKVKVTGTNHSWNGQDHLKIGKVYDIISNKGLIFSIINDLGNESFCVWKDCPHGFTYQKVKDEFEAKGGPSDYYDFDASWVTLNECMEHLSKSRWKEYSLHFKDIMKASFRFGAKEGNDLEYDVNKIIYSALRLLIMLKGKTYATNYLKKLLDDPQFK